MDATFRPPQNRQTPTFAEAGITPTCDAKFLRRWYIVVGEQMTNEETIQMEDVITVAEQQAWERLHEAIFKELFPQNRTAKSTNPRD